MSIGSEAHWLEPVDDVATALRDLRAGSTIGIAAHDATRRIRLREDIPAGHKFSVRPLAAGLRIRKYGEFIGRLNEEVGEGAWIHVHNLATCATGRADCEVRDEAADVLSVLGETRACVGESPVWDAETGRLYWVDVRERPSISMVEIQTLEQTTFPMTEEIGSIVLTQCGRLIAAMRSGLALFDPRTGALNPLHDPEPELSANRLNDGKCDAEGRLWFGSLNPDSSLAEGSLYILGTDLQCRLAMNDLVTPNGHAWSLDGRTMYLSDTRRGLIHAHDFDAGTGDFGPPRTFADLGHFPGGPDGATIDRKGFLWSAQFNGGCLVRFSPDGRMDRIVRLPVSKPTSCTFGGPDHDHLYVTSAARGMGQGRLAAEPLAGRVLVLDVGVGGFPPARFKKKFIQQ